MNKNFTKVVLLICLGVIYITQSNAQVFRKVEPVVCPVDPVAHDTFVAPPEVFLNKMRKNARGEQAKGAAEIIVTYNDFTPEAQDAFQFAVDIWASLLDSPVPIYVNANYIELESGVIGSAGPTSTVANFDGAPLNNTFYALPLAEKIAGKTLNPNGDADINASFSSVFDFYFGTDGMPPAGQIDFVTIVLHELGHGLGFTTSRGFDEDSNEGSFNLDAYNSYIELGDGTLLSSLANPSTEIGDAFTGGDIFFNAPLSVLELGERPELYAPTTFAGGSSVAHLDEATYPAGNVNSLMSPQVGNGEAIHDPGIALDMFADMGWVHTYLSHTNTNEFTENTVDPFAINLSVTSDTTINILLPVLTYTFSDFDNAVELAMIDSGDGINYSANIPNPGITGSIIYYITGVQDGLGRDYSTPGSAPDNFHQINIIDSATKTVPYLSADGGSFEVNQSDFLAVSLSGDDVDWELGVPTNALDQTASGTNVWKTKLDVDVVRPTAVTASALISPYFDLSDDTQNHSLSFSFSMESAFTDDTGIFTTGPYGFHVQYSTDDSQTWQLLGDINDQRGNNWYNVKETSGNVFPNESNAGWIKHTFEVNGTDTTFVTEEVSYNISDLTGNSKVNFRVVFYVSPNFIDAGYTADGVLIDDFEIKKSSPTAEFASLNAGVLFPGAEVEFEYLSTGASSYLWDFGDGGTSDVANPKHIYSAGGSFDVTLTITSPDGNASLTKENLIGVISQKSVPYSTTDGGDLEGANQDFIILNVSGTGFELGSSAVAGKSGTASGSNALVTGADDDQYANRSEAYIYMPQFDFSILGSYELNFAANYSFEEGWDGFNVEYSLDNGTTWVILNATPEEGWYDQVAVENSDGFWNELPIFTGTTNDVFETKTTDVSFLASEGFVSFRVKFLSDAAATDVGMVIDDFQMIGPAGGEAVVDFSFEGNTDCSGHSVVFTNNSTGTIQALDWDFGTGATPATAEGIGPHTVIFESSTAITSKITLTATSSISGTVVSEQSIDTSPNFDAEPFTITSVEGETVLVAPEGDLFQWFVNGGIIDGATSQNLTVTQFGSNYSVEVFRGGCSAVSSEQSVVSGIDAKLEEFGVAVFPNPAKSSVNISIGRQIKSYLTIKMFNYSGKQIFIYTVNESMDSYQKAIDLSDQKAGLYHIELVIDGERLSTKILVE